MRSVCAFASDATSVHCQESRLPAQTSIEPRVVAGLADEMAGLAGEREAESGLAILAAHACRVQTSDRARDQVFPRVVRPAAPPVHDAGSGLSTERDTCFVNIVRPHGTPWFIRMVGGACSGPDMTPKPTAGSPAWGRLAVGYYP
jgi:hypothetical protein